MDALITINKVSSDMGISSRTLRYWESAGLFKSIRDTQSGWRMYDDYTLQCIRITNFLRRLDFSIRDIKDVMERKTIDSCVGVEPEDEAYGVVQEWLDNTSLNGTARIFGFNVEPHPSAENPGYGFGYCATIPEGVDISAPLYEMRLPGGTYALVPDDGGGPETGWNKVRELCDDCEWGWTWDGDRNPGLEEHIYLAEGGPIIHILFPVKKK